MISFPQPPMRGLLFKKDEVVRRDLFDSSTRLMLDTELNRGRWSPSDEEFEVER